MTEQNIYGREKVSKLVFKVAVPSMLAQFISVLYSIVDRIFVGNIPGSGDLSLAGVGICGPIVTLIGAFAFLVGIGGTPLMGIALGEGNRERAKKILANCFIMILTVSVAVTAVSFIVKEPILHLFGASDNTYPYAEQYFTIYISGTLFALIASGMNQFIVAQGYAKTGMMSIVIGAIMNIILDPIFIYVLKLGVRGAALATIISQASSAFFVLLILLKKTDIRLSFGGYSFRTILEIAKIGMTPFLIIASDNVMIIVMNALLLKYGGAQSDALITCNTIVQSFMLVMTMPLGGISGGTQGILSFNYGARRTDRVLSAQKFIFALCIGYTALMFIFARTAAPAFASLFTRDPVLNEQACQAIRICTIGAVPLGIQYEIVDGFTAIGKVQLSFPLSFFRKASYFISIIIIPMFCDPSMIFYAETVSDIAGPIVSVTVYSIFMKKILKSREAA